MIKVWSELEEKNYSNDIKNCINIITSNNETKYWVEKIEVNSYFERLYLKVSEFKIRMFSLNAWGRMKAYYGFDICYDKGEFTIGGYETEKIVAPTLIELINKVKILPD